LHAVYRSAVKHSEKVHKKKNPVEALPGKKKPALAITEKKIPAKSPPTPLPEKITFLTYLIYSIPGRLLNFQ